MTEPGAPAAAPRRSPVKVAVALLLLAGLGTAIAGAPSPGAGGTPAAGASAAPSPGAAGSAPAHPSGVPKATVTELLGGLAVGDEIVGWPVERIAVERHELIVSFARADSGFQVRLSRPGLSPNLAPIHAGRLDVFYGFVREYGGPVPADAPQRAAEALAERVRKALASKMLPDEL